MISTMEMEQSGKNLDYPFWTVFFDRRDHISRSRIGSLETHVAYARGTMTKRMFSLSYDSFKEYWLNNPWFALLILRNVYGDKLTLYTINRLYLVEGKKLFERLKLEEMAQESEFPATLEAIIQKSGDFTSFFGTLEIFWILINVSKMKLGFQDVNFLAGRIFNNVSGKKSPTVTGGFLLFFINLFLLATVAYSGIFSDGRRFQKVSNDYLNDQKHLVRSDLDDLIADLEFINDANLTKKLKKDWTPGLLSLLISDPMFAIKSVTQRFQR
jgi:hypothetical protein